MPSAMEFAVFILMTGAGAACIIMAIRREHWLPLFAGAGLLVGVLIKLAELLEQAD